MQFVNIHDAKTNLSKYLAQVVNDHSTIVICNNKPVAQLSEYKPKKARKLGIWKGQIKMADDFNDEMPEDFMKYFI